MEAELLEKGRCRSLGRDCSFNGCRGARAEWKRKCRESKDALQAQRVRVRDLEASRDHWRAGAKQAQLDRQRESVQQAAQVENKVRPKSS